MNTVTATELNSSQTTVSDLPEEILLMKYVEHGDLLASRVVNKTWNNAIFNFHQFPTSKMIYVVKPGKGEDSADYALNKSTVPWKRLRLEEFRRAEQLFELPVALSSAIKCLEISNSTVSWPGNRGMFFQLQALEELHILQCNLSRKKYKSSLGGNKTVKITNLKSISFEVENFFDMAYFINRFNLIGVSKLVSISLKEMKKTNDRFEENTAEKAIKLLSSIFTLYQRSSTSLKSLRVSFKSSHLTDNFFPEVVKKLIGLVDLNTFWVEHQFARSKENRKERDMDIFIRFVQSQKNLNAICLPCTSMRNTNSKIWNKLLQAVNKNIRRMKVPNANCTEDNILDIFPELTHLAYGFHYGLNLQDIREDFYPKIHSLEFKSSGFWEISVKFPNLTKLTLDSCNGVSSDEQLQMIIKNLKKLKCLCLENCSHISDNGISGVRSDYCKGIFESRRHLRFGKGDDMGEMPQKDFIIGAPLSSLTGLTHLTLSGEVEFSDVGIFYGFRFNELRNLNIRILSHGHVRITNWGLESLAKWNPYLDRFYFKCGALGTNLARRNVKTHLCRIKGKHLRFEYNAGAFCRRVGSRRYSGGSSESVGDCSDPGGDRRDSDSDQ